MTADLKIARGFALPLELVTEATAIVATRGAGKSSTSAVIVEEGFDAGVQTVVFDRTGVYWGLRSNAKGNGPGLGIYVLGGPHGDVPLEPSAGVLIADLVVDSGHSFVLDLSDFSKSAAIRFAADFLERLYDRKARSRTTTLLVLDEAHFYAPQTPRGGFKGDSARLMGAMEDIVGLGRSRGIGAVLTTQRTQALNKAVLDLIETLLVMRMLSPRARDAVQDWIREKHEDDREGVIATLESLPTGTAWVWSPLRGILQKVAVRRIHTFDSYATPKPGEVRVEPSARKQLDLGALGDQMRATAERAKDNDPAELRKRIRELEAVKPGGDFTSILRALADHGYQPVGAETLTRVVERALSHGQTAGVAEALDEFSFEQDDAETLPQTVRRALAELAAGQKVVEVPLLTDEMMERLVAVGQAPADALAEISTATALIRSYLDEFASISRELSTVPTSQFPRPRMEEIGRSGREVEDDGTGRGRVIEVRRERLEATSSREPRQARRQAQGSLVVAVDGVKVGKGEMKVLQALAEFPEGRTHNELAFLTGYSAGASTIGTFISKLRAAGLVEQGQGPRGFRATAEGLAAAGGVVERPTGPALLDEWLRHPKMELGMRAVLNVLVDRYPDEPTHEELCDATGYSPTASTVGTFLSKLRKLGLVEGGRKLSPAFAEAIR